MKWPVCACRSHSPRPHGYTLVEMLVATMLTLMLVFAVTSVFSRISQTVNDSRANLETMDALRSVRAKLQRDLENHTCVPIPPADQGYVEIIEGDGSIIAAIDRDSGGADPTVRDHDDIIILTTRASGQPFVGLHNGTAIEADVAEVAWFMRGNVLIRRILLVMPGAAMPAYSTSTSYFQNNDISARTDETTITANTLRDLANRQKRYGHDPSAFPFLVNWGSARLPTLGECAQGWPTIPTHSPGDVDYWRDYRDGPPIYPYPIAPGATPPPRYIEDVILTNVIGFDVKVWDPGAPIMPGAAAGDPPLLPGDSGYVPNSTNAIGFGAFVDMGYAPGYVPASGDPLPSFNHVGYTNSAGLGALKTYDSWTLRYENNGVNEDNDSLVDEGTNGLDDDGNGIIDDAGERETIPPYPVPLRGIQIKIRVFEPDSRHIREVTVVQDFLPK